MAFLIPDIFSAAIKGYEDANKANWQDLKNYEAIEAARTANDQANLNLLAGIEDYANARVISDAAGTQANAAAQLINANLPGQLNQAWGNEIVSGAKYSALLGQEPQLRQATANQLQGNVSTMNVLGQTQAGKAAVDANNLPLILGAYGDQVQSGVSVSKINAAAAPNIATATNQSNLAALGANTTAAQTSQMQAQATQSLIPTTTAVQADTLKTGQEQLQLQKQQQKLAQINALQSQENALLANVARIQERLAAIRVSPAGHTTQEVQAITQQGVAFQQQLNLVRTQLATLNATK